MTVATTDYRKSYTSTGGTTYAYTWPIHDDSWLAVYVEDALQTLNSDYTVTGVGDGSGGNVVFGTAPSAGDTVVIIPAVPLQQLTDFAHNSKFPEETVENAFDTLTVIAKQHEEALDRTLRFPAYSGSSGGVLPEPVLNQSLRWSAVTPPTLQNYTVVDDPTSITLPLTQANGGLGKDMSAVTGVLTMNGGTCYEMTGTILPADATSTAVQAAIDSGAKKILLDPAITYAFTSVVTLTRVSNDGGIEIDGQGATVTGDGVIANCFLVDGPGVGEQFNRVKIHNITFGGTVTGAFVKVETGATWWHDYANLHALPTTTADALLEFHNESAASNPGGFTVTNLKAPSPTVQHTVLFSKEVAALGDFDDFHLNVIQGGVESTIEVEDGCNVVQSDLRNILSSSNAIRTVNTGLVQNSQIARVYLEPIVAEVPSTGVHYAVSGGFYHCGIENVHGYITSTDDYPDATRPCRMLYGTFFYNRIANVSLRSGNGTTGYPYRDLSYYYIIRIIAGTDNTLDFPADDVPTACYLGESGTVWPITFTQGPVSRIENVTNTVYEWEQAGCLLNNYGQGAAATITLQPAKAGMSVRFTIASTGFAYHVKPDAGDRIKLDGTLLDDGDKVSNASPAVGDAVVLFTYVSGAVGDAYTYDWIARSEGGTWTDGGA